MTDTDWVKELPAAVTVCDADGTILFMNDMSIKAFEEDGGAALVGTNLLDCHPEPSRSKLEESGPLELSFASSIRHDS